LEKKLCDAHISIQLPDEAGEVVVLEMFGQDVCGELGNVPDNKGVVVFAPGHDRIG